MSTPAGAFARLPVVEFELELLVELLVLLLELLLVPFVVCAQAALACKTNALTTKPVTASKRIPA